MTKTATQRTSNELRRANGTEAVNSNNGGGTQLPPYRLSVPFIVHSSLINERTIGADHRLGPFQVIPRLKCQPVEGGGVEGEGEADGDLGGDGVGVGDERFNLIGGYAAATGELGGVEGARDQVGVQQDVAGGSQGLRGVHF